MTAPNPSGESAPVDNEQKARRSSPILSDASALTGLTFLAYILTYRYESGWLAFYQLPSSLVQFDLTSVFAVLAGMGTFITVLAYTLMIVPVNIRKYSSGIVIILCIALLTIVTYFVIAKRPIQFVLIGVIVLLDALCVGVTIDSIQRAGTME